MLASQLIRVLQTLPTQVNHETCGFDTVESKGTMKENPNGILCHSNGYARDADELVSEMKNKDEFCNTRELKCSVVTDDFTKSTENAIRDSLANEHQNGDFCRVTGCGGDAKCSQVVDDFANGNEDENRDSVAQCSIPSQLFDDTDLYTVKNVGECDLPELMVCYKESTYYDVKDICIDQEVPSSDKKVVTENREVYHKDLCISLPCDENEDREADGLKSSLEKDCDKDGARESETKEKMDVKLLIPDGLKSSSKVVIDMNASKECVAEDSTRMGETYGNATEKVMGDDSTEEFVPSGVLPEHEFGTQKSLTSHLQSSDGNEVEQQSGQISCAKPVLENTVVISVAEDSKKNDTADKISYNSKVENGTIPFDFESSKSAAGNNDDNPEHVHEKLLESRNVPSLDDGVSDTLSVTSKVQTGEGKSSSYVHEQTFESQNVPSRHNGVADPFLVSNHVQYGEGESSFSMSGPLSGLVTYSGPIAFSGSISVRSDGSATSTRSFAFPILQHEWNCSPVKMEKADRRHFQKRKGWRHCFLCSRF